MKELATTIHNIVIDEAFCAAKPDQFDRRTRELPQQISGARLLGELAVHKILRGIAAPVRSAVERPYEQAGYSVLSAGGNSTVYTKEDSGMVHKLIRETIRYDRETQEEYAQKYQSLHDTTEYFLGNYTLPQVVGVDTHPYKMGSTAVIFRQPYTDFTALPENESELSTHLKAQLREFLARSEEMLMTTGYVADIAGISNIVVTTDDQLLLLDTIPCSPDSISERTMRHVSHRYDTLHMIAKK